MVINYNVAAMTINYNNKLVCDDDKLQLIMIYHIHQRWHEWAGRDLAPATAGDLLIDCAMYEYQTFYWVSNSLLDIKQFTGYQIVYWISNSLLGIKLFTGCKQFTGYQTVYWVLNSLLGIEQFTEYQSVYWISRFPLDSKV